MRRRRLPPEVRARATGLQRPWYATPDALRTVFWNTFQSAAGDSRRHQAAIVAIVARADLAEEAGSEGQRAGTKERRAKS